MTRLLMAVIAIVVGAGAGLAYAAAPPVAAPAATPAAPPTLDEVLAQAKREQRPLVLEFFTTWCEPCKALEKDIFPNSLVQRALAPAIFVRYDAEHGNGVAAAARYKVQGFPLILVLDPDGKLVGKHEGAGEPATAFAAFFDAQLAQALSAPAVKALEADASRGPGRHLTAARWYAAHADDKRAMAAFAAAVKADPRGTAGVAADASWGLTRLRVKHERRATLVKEAAAIVDRYPGSAAASEALPLAVLSGDLSHAQTVKLLARRRAALAGNAADLNDFIYVAIAARACDEAIAAGQAAVALTPDDANVYDSLGEAYHCAGQTQKATEAIAIAQQRVGKGQASMFDDDAKRFAAGNAESPDLAVMRARAQADLDGTSPPGAVGDGASSMIGEGGGRAGEGQASPAVQAAFTAAMTLIRMAANGCAAKKGTSAGTEIELTLPAAEGGKADIKIVDDARLPPPLKQCLTEKLNATKWPAGGSANMKMRVPVTF